ncbi:21593_t:CDS:2 [Cetraspora pellucida]|uniref:21593_t:CDS:1 n=1 Tax=Cetraspora pellucida TaxID=1433469 RepID=A0A9N9AJS2_9GLOM|nr:21593_t:CDS:2 [Cetraspora pellucida]
MSINTNQGQLAGCIDNIEDGVTNILENVYEMKEDVKKIVVTMLKGFEDFYALKKMIEAQTEGALIKDDIIEKPLNPHDFSRMEEERGNTRKWIRDSDNYEVAFTEMRSLPENLYFEVKWSKYGSLEEYYRNEKLEYSLKLQIALDIVRGLNFLQAYKILHHDVRSANVMIDSHKHAKLANFGMSRHFADASKNLKNVIDDSRYKAPEKINYRDYKYDSRCEVFRNDVPEKWKRLVFKATEHDPRNHPNFERILLKLKSLTEKSDTSTNKNTSPTLTSFIRSIMPIEEAIKQHKLKDGNRQEAWKPFEFYSKLGDTTAKYYKAYYLYKNLMRLCGNEEDRLKQATNLFKEAADEGDMLKAQIQYASCLYKGTGVVKNLSLALKYFSKAADKGDSEAIFNVGNMYYKGLGVNKNVKKGITLIKSAAFKGYKTAIMFCKANKISL